MTEQLSKNFGNTAFAVMNHDDALLYWLYEKGKLVDSYDSMSLFYEGEEEAAAIVRLLIDAGADVNARGFDGIRALHEAVRAGMTGTVKALLDCRGG